MTYEQYSNLKVGDKVVLNKSAYSYTKKWSIYGYYIFEVIGEKNMNIDINVLDGSNNGVRYDWLDIHHPLTKPQYLDETI